jgi:mono/diheme cytochrome c family protein
MPANLKKVLLQYTDARKLEEKTTMRRKIAMAMVGLLVGSGAAAAAHAADAAAGKALYEKSCAGCHGPDGKGNQKMATILGEKGLNIVGKDTAKKSDDQLLKIISEGAGKMPAAKLTKEEQKQALSYVRSLAK